MKKTCKLALFGLSAAALLLADLSPEAPLGLGFVREAAAIIGAPLTPMSYAGVARRTTRRVVAVSATSAAAASSAAAATTAAAATPRPPPPPPAAGPVPVGTVVHALPPGCVATPIGGVQYYSCAPRVYYRAAFQGNNLVYVAAQP